MTKSDANMGGSGADIYSYHCKFQDFTGGICIKRVKATSVLHTCCFLGRKTVAATTSFCSWTDDEAAPSGVVCIVFGDPNIGYSVLFPVEVSPLHASQN